ncbi:Protein kinase dsk1 [Zancudomyces culisetae]|uniref:non-specific serine/threonine protein kinase n=1 Tax=Zancudomyces culisetae TaxID=1213189 RepID=A0A1R1PKV7_ZANCU|nr:Protein kinase dsk1 [Zancudomyces culisetae]|eukprot:OMH81594.1 Protein kinase dsk1 [Zancudomyces culisetae]
MKKTEYHSSGEDEEDIEDYRLGGYHPVRIGEKFKDGRYEIIRKLGWGHFSTVWLAYDKQNDNHVALKIVKSAKRYTEAANDEIQLCERAATSSPTHRGYKHVVLLIDHFEHKGPNGVHVCMVFEVLGENLLCLLRNAKNFTSLGNGSNGGGEGRGGGGNRNGLPMHIVRQVARQILEGLSYLHGPCRMIHTDLKPENVLVCIENVEDVIRKQIGRSPARSEHNLARNSGEHSNSLVRNMNEIKLGDPSITSNNHMETDVKDSTEPNQISTTGGSGTSETDGSAAVPDSNNGSRSNQKPSSLQFKIADLGNATWIERHFTEDIQTRQYRSPEVIIGAPWNSSADIWSCACMIFELLTGEYLFEPRSGARYNKDDDHLAQIIETIGPIPKRLAVSGSYSSEFFNKRGELRHIKTLNPLSLEEILHEEYRFSRSDSVAFANFLLPMLDVNPLKRASAEEMLRHPWLN